MEAEEAVEGGSVVKKEETGQEDKGRGGRRDGVKGKDEKVRRNKKNVWGQWRGGEKGREGERIEGKGERVRMQKKNI